ncbi:MAG: hypothetical protein GY696_36950, partial [Gammaproteobacteria bacterium]|nr:hypothetical protein [Gammaproteobacteria bacterium]
MESAFSGVQNPRDFWKTVKKFTSKRSNATLPLQRPDGTVAFSVGEKAAALSTEFHKNFNWQDIPPSPILPGDIHQDWWCEEHEVSAEIAKLKSDSAIGLDGVSSKTLKNCVDQIAAPLTFLLNRCLYEAEFPSVWKLAKISPIQKIPGTDLVSSFRPISVLPALSKIAERWMKRIITPFVFSIPDWNQFAYTPGRAVEDAAGLLQFYVTAGFNACPGVTRVAVVSLDVKKAFDSIPVNKMIHVLRHHYHLPDTLAQLVKSYLSNRFQTTCMDGEVSAEQPVISGVPQGSILGPHFFNAYITSVLSTPVSEATRLIAFVDDLLVVKPIRCQEDVRALQQDIDAII